MYRGWDVWENGSRVEKGSEGNGRGRFVCWPEQVGGLLLLCEDGEGLGIASWPVAERRLRKVAD